jgi:hypothetical protein
MRDFYHPTKHETPPQYIHERLGSDVMQHHLCRTNPMPELLSTIDALMTGMVALLLCFWLNAELIKWAM